MGARSTNRADAAKSFRQRPNNIKPRSERGSMALAILRDLLSSPEIERESYAAILP